MQYTQNWTTYNLAQTKEKVIGLKLLSDAIDYLDIPYKYKGNGRPSIGISEMIKCCLIKVFNNFSSRRTISELLLAKGLGILEFVPHFNTINNYMKNSEMSQYLHELYKIIALPLAQIETDFAIDASGFSTSNKAKWYEIKISKRHENARDYKKLHIVTGIRTNIITSAKITRGKDHDSPYFEELIKNTAVNFNIKKICADAGYLSRKNCDVSVEVGAVPYIWVKKNINIKRARGSLAWKRMVNLWHDNHDLFKEQYHKRSNVESTFSMLKRKYNAFVRSKTEIAQENEILCKVVAHNLAVLIQAIFELNIEIPFEQD